MVGSNKKGFTFALLILICIGFFRILTAYATPIFQDRFEGLSSDPVRAGSAFKGPFRIGSAVTLLSLRSNLTQTGDPFFGDIISNDGQYRIDADTPPGVVELIVTGPFFHEALNDNTTQSLTLSALSERTGILNINLLSAIERDRIRALVGAGSSFGEAKAQAVAELFNIFGAVPSVDDTTAISLTDSDAPVLLALTAMLVTRPDGAARSVPDMQELITQLRTDFGSGQLNRTRSDVLFRSAAAVDTDTIRSNLIAYYASIGVSVDIPDFSQAVRDFLTVTGFEIQVSSNNGGEISPSGSVWGLPDEQVEFQITPAEGFTLDSLGGSCQGTLVDSVFTTDPLTEDCTLSAEFTKNVYTVTPVAGTNGSIEPVDPQTVEHGNTLEFELFSDEGYSATSVSGSCGGQIDGDNYTTAPVTQNCEFTISFELNSYLVSASVIEGNGTINPAEQNVLHGSNAQWQLNPDPGWVADSLTGDTCDPVAQSSGQWLVEGIIEPCAVEGSFSPASTISAVSSLTQSGTVGRSVAELPEVEVADDQGRLVAGTVVIFAYTADDDRLIEESVTTGAGGRAKAPDWVLPKTVGESLMTVSSEGLSGSPIIFSATALPGPASLGNSTITADAKLIGVGSGSTQITVQLFDEFGNALQSSDGEVEINSSSGGISSTVNNADGTYSAELTAGAANDLAIISATLNDVLLPQTYQVIFCGASETFIYSGVSVTYGTVDGGDNRCWLDRNLGAQRVAEAVDDYLGYGDFFQWGRGDDGHQTVTWTNSTSATLTVTRQEPSLTDQPGHSDFLVPFGDWRVPRNDDLWQGVNGINNPCPNGWRLPTASEWMSQVSLWELPSSAGGFESPLAMTVMGIRQPSGELILPTLQSTYHASDIFGEQSRSLVISPISAEIGQNARAAGRAVRCILGPDLES